MGKALAKPDRIGHELTVSQRNAIDALVSGKRDAEVAELVGVSRQTICIWRNRDPVFVAELNRARSELWAVAVDALRALLPRAVAVLGEELAGSDCARVALDIVKLAGLDRARAPQKLDTFLVGPTDPSALVDAEVWRRRPDRPAYHGPVTDAERAAVLAEAVR